MSAPLLAYYGDDFTGSTDALEFLTRAGARTVLFTGTPSPAALNRFGELDAVGVAGCTRALRPDDMERELRPAFETLRALGSRHVHYKVCSTFDSSPQVGSIGRAIDIGATIFGGRYVPLVVGAPPLGRYCVFGNLFARFGIGSAGAIHRLDRHPVMNRHPVTPMDESDLRRHLGKQTTKRIELLDVLTLAKSSGDACVALERIVAADAGSGADIPVVLFDVLTNEHLERIGELLDAEENPRNPLFSVGSSGVEMALGRKWGVSARLRPRHNWETPAPAQPLLVISGSCSAVTIGQIRWAVRAGFAETGIAIADCDRGRASIVEQACTELRAGRHVIIHTQPESRGTDASAEAVGGALGGIASDLIAATGVRRLLVAGGDTSSYAARALGIEAVEMIAPLAPGAPLCRAHAAGSPVDGIEVNFKGGQVGGEDYFGAVARGTL